MDVLKKILKAGLEEELHRKKSENGGHLEAFKQNQTEKKQKRSPGRPKIADNKKAKHITLCLPQKYVRFLDEMKVKRAPGRSKKVKYIVDEFLELKKREKRHLETFSQTLLELKNYLDELGSQKTSKKLLLEPKEKKQIQSQVDQVFILAKLLGFKKEELQRKMSKADYLVLLFCLDWRRNQKWTS